MWKFLDLNSACNLWPPYSELSPESMVFPSYANTNGCSSMNACIPFPCFGAQGRPFHLNPDFVPLLNLKAFNPLICSSELNATTSTNRLFSSDQSMDKKCLILSSVAAPIQTVKPNPPASNAAHASSSHFHGRADQKELQEDSEDSEEINALLYSDSESSCEIEEASTGHSPLDIKEEDITSSLIPAKRRRLNLNHAELDESLIDTASSPFVPFDKNGDQNYADSVNPNNKLERIHAVVKVLRMIIPGGNAMDSTAIIDEAIRYLKSLKLQASALDCVEN